MYIHKEKPRLCFGERFALTCSNVARSLWWLTLASISKFQVDIIITCILIKIRRARFESASQLYITASSHSLSQLMNEWWEFIYRLREADDVKRKKKSSWGGSAGPLHS